MYYRIIYTRNIIQRTILTIDAGTETITIRLFIK